MVSCIFLLYIILHRRENTWVTVIGNVYANSLFVSIGKWERKGGAKGNTPPRKGTRALIAHYKEERAWSLALRENTKNLLIKKKPKST